MAYDHHSSSGAAPARARSNKPAEPANEASEESSPQATDSTEPAPLEPVPPQNAQNLGDLPVAPPPGPPYRPRVSDDLRVPWGWMEVALLALLGLIGSVVVTYGAALIAVRVFGVPRGEVFGDTMSTAKSVVVLLSQALLDFGALLYLYLMLAARTNAPFWPSIGWREMRPGTGKIREAALHFLAGGALLAIVVSFAGAYLNSKATLPIEELLQARVSVVLFGVLGVLVAPLVEETIFRGFLYPVVARWLGVAGGVLVTGTLFGLMHAAQLWGGWGQIALLILVGVVLTWVRARTGTVVASYFVHLGYNGLQLVGYLVYVIGHK
jgi:membrane protease YdiL (CAAX protease family)